LLNTLYSYHNSFPEAIKRVSKIALSELGENASEEDKAATEVQVFKGDITNPADIDAIFKAYEGKGGIWGMIHIAAHKAVGESGEVPIQYYKNNINATVNLLDVSTSLYALYNQLSSRMAHSLWIASAPVTLSTLRPQQFTVLQQPSLFPKQPLFKPNHATDEQKSCQR